MLLKANVVLFPKSEGKNQEPAGKRLPRAKDDRHGAAFKGRWEIKLNLCFDSSPHIERVQYMSVA